MKRITVCYAGWGEQWRLGTLADDGRELLFEYAPAALASGLELSPLHLRLRAPAYSGFPAHLQRLPGLIADALPDGWGLLVMDRFFRGKGVDPAALSPLDRLAFIGSRGLGALTFEPADAPGLSAEDVHLLALARGARAVIAGKDSETLRLLALMGGSPHGTRPKVLVHYCAQAGVMGTQPMAGCQPWLVKFQAHGEHKEACALEDVYAQLARDCGLDMPATRSFDLDRTLAAFGIARFDVEQGLRVPVHTLAGALHADFRMPSVDYNAFLRATRALTRDEREVRKAYERAAFNVLFNNRDDHARNFSFRLGRDRQWRLAPGYDLTFCEGPGGEHRMDVCGEAREITRAHMLALARQAGVDPAWSMGVLDRMGELAVGFKGHAAGRGIRAATIKRVAAAIAANRKRLA